MARGFKHEQGDGAKQCCLCQIEFPASNRGRVDYAVDSEGNFYCRERKYCRARCLPTILALGPYAQVDREHYRFQMDVRPPGHKDIGWRSIHSVEERVEAAIIYHSLCFPVCMPYACELNADDSDVIYDSTQAEGIRYLRRERLAAILNMAQPHVHAAAQRLVGRRKIHIDEDGRLFSLQRPQITLLQRSEVFAARTAEKYALPPGLIRRFERQLAAKSADEETCTRVFEMLLETRTRFLRILREARYSEKEGYMGVSTWLHHHIVSSISTKPSSSSPSPSSEVPHHVDIVPGGDGDEPTLKEMYAAGAGKHALAKLPPHPRQLPPDTVIEKGEPAVVEQISLALEIDLEAAERIWLESRKLEPAITVDEIVALAAGVLDTTSVKSSKTGTLVKYVPKAAAGGPLAAARKRLAAVAARPNADATLYAYLERIHGEEWDRNKAAEREAQERQTELRERAVDALTQEKRLALTVEEGQIRYQAFLKREAGELKRRQLTKEQQQAWAESALLRDLREEAQREVMAKAAEAGDGH